MARPQPSSFVSHGAPMMAVEPEAVPDSLRTLGRELGSEERPPGILCPPPTGRRRGRVSYQGEIGADRLEKTRVCIRPIWVALVLAGVSCSSPSTPPTLHALGETNVLLITVDTLRADHLGYHGYQRDTSPFLDSFARRSLTFLQASVQIPKTQPSLASMMSSRYPGATGVLSNWHVLPDHVLTLADVLQSNGFHAVAHTTNGNLTAKQGIAQGFDEFSSSLIPASGLTTWIIERLEQGFPGRFFLWAHYIDPHGPYTPPAPYDALYLDDERYDQTKRVRLRYTPQPGFNVNYVLGAVPRYQQAPFRAQKRRRQVDFYVSKYDGEIRYLDDQIGRLLQYLQGAGWLDSTLVIFTADHGEGLGEHNYYFDHGWFVYQHQLHVPLLIHSPGHGPALVGRPVRLIDLAPTILDLLGIVIPDSFQGNSLIPLLGERPEAAMPVYATTPREYPHHFAALRYNKWKYVVDAEGHEELFDLDSDPGEIDSLADEEEENLLLFRTWMSRGLWSSGDSQQPIELPVDSLDQRAIERLKSLGYVR